jgi:hypothetical protein
MIGTVVCNSTQRFGRIEWVNTPLLATQPGGLVLDDSHDHCQIPFHPP